MFQAIRRRIESEGYSAMEKTKRSWLFADDRHLIQLAKSSKSLEAVADEMRRTPDNIAKRAKRLGISFKGRQSGAKTARK